MPRRNPYRLLPAPRTARRNVEARNARLLRTPAAIPPPSAWLRVHAFLTGDGPNPQGYSVRFLVETTQGDYQGAINFYAAASEGWDDDFGGPSHRGPMQVPRREWPRVYRWIRHVAYRATGVGARARRGNPDDGPSTTTKTLAFMDGAATGAAGIGALLLLGAAIKAAR